MIIMSNQNNLLHSGSSDIIILYLNPLVSDGWRLTIHIYISLVCIRVFVMQIRYAVWVILTVGTRTWHCELRLVVDGFFIMLVHPRPIMQREKSQQACTITFPLTKIKQNFPHYIKIQNFSRSLLPHFLISKPKINLLKIKLVRIKKARLFFLLNR